MIKARNLHKSFGSLQVLKGVDAEIKKGEYVYVIGPSDSGKSTFLRYLNLLEQPGSGGINIDGVDVMDVKYDVDRLRPNMDMAFQHFNLFPHLTIMENLTLASLKLKLMMEEEANAKAKTLLERVDVGNEADSYPDKLSDGQRQCMTITRALTLSPKVMLFDKSTPALNPEIVGEVLEVMKQLTSRGMTMIVVTYEMGFAREVGDWVYFIDKGAALKPGTPRGIFENPQNERTRSFLSEVLQNRAMRWRSE